MNEESARAESDSPNGRWLRGVDRVRAAQVNDSVAETATGAAGAAGTRDDGQNWKQHK